MELLSALHVYMLTAFSKTVPIDTNAWFLIGTRRSKLRFIYFLLELYLSQSYGVWWSQEACG